MINTGRTPEGAARAAAYKAAYDAANTTQIKFKLNNKTDADILAHLDRQQNKQGYIKALIREDIKRRMNMKKYTFTAESFGSECPTNYKAICDYLNAILCERLDGVDPTDDREIRDRMDGLWEEWCSGDLEGAPEASWIWYAVMPGGDEDNLYGWDNGSADRKEAIAMAREWRTDGHPDAYVAVIDTEGGETLCVDEIHDIDD